MVKPPARKTLNNDSPVIAANIRRLREVSGMTQADIAHALGVSHQQVQKYESGANRIPLQVLPRLCDLFGVPAEALLRGVGPSIPAGQSFEHDLDLIFGALARVKNRRLRNRIARAVDILCGEA